MSDDHAASSRLILPLATSVHVVWAASWSQDPPKLRLRQDHLVVSFAKGWSSQAFGLELISVTRKQIFVICLELQIHEDWDSKDGSHCSCLSCGRSSFMQGFVLAGLETAFTFKRKTAVAKENILNNLNLHFVCCGSLQSPQYLAVLWDCIVCREFQSAHPHLSPEVKRLLYPEMNCSFNEPRLSWNETFTLAVAVFPFGVVSEKPNTRQGAVPVLMKLLGRSVLSGYWSTQCYMLTAEIVWLSLWVIRTMKAAIMLYTLAAQLRRLNRSELVFKNWRESNRFLKGKSDFQHNFLAVRRFRPR